MLDSECRAEPAEVDIVVGQTVYFALTKGPGVSITAEALVKGGRMREPAARMSGAAFFRRSA